MKLAIKTVQWTETNNLADIIERHLWDYLESNDNGKKE